MSRRKSNIYYDDDFKATAVALSEIPGVVAKHVAEVLEQLFDESELEYWDINRNSVVKNA